MNNLISEMKILENSNEPKNNMIYKISGAIGLAKIKKLNNLNKEIFIFYDNHANLNYCDDSENIFINDFFDDIIKSTSDCIFLLEEPFINSYLKIKFLWNNTPHIVKFRNFYKKIMIKCANDEKECRIFPTDIRLILVEVSYDELLDNLNDNEYYKDLQLTCPTILKYFEKILYLFDIVENIQINLNENNNLIFIKNIFDLNKEYEYYKRLKNKLVGIYQKYIIPHQNIELIEFVKIYRDNTKTHFNFGYPYEYSNFGFDENFCDEYDKFINGVMELYIFLLIEKMPNKNIVIHMGFYHSYNLVYIMEKYCNYEKIYSQGTTTKSHIENNSNSNVSNCLYVNKKVFENFYIK